MHSISLCNYISNRYGIGKVTAPQRKPSPQATIRALYGDLSSLFLVSQTKANPSLLGTINIFCIHKEANFYPAGVERDIEDGAAPENMLLDCPRCNHGHHATFCSCHDEPYCTIYPWTKNSLFNSWTVFFWAVSVFSSLCTCIYTASSSRVNEGFTMHNTWWKAIPHFSNSTSTNPTNSTSTVQTNDTSQPGDLLLDLSNLNYNAANDLVLYVFVFRALLVILASYFAVAWFSAVDRSTRFSQPFANMYNKEASSTDSVLLDYMWGLPGLVTFNALTNGHGKVAWFSLLDL
jgi:hypothetical protein